VIFIVGGLQASAWEGGRLHPTKKNARASEVAQFFRTA
jgi:hypothetical protein